MKVMIFIVLIVLLILGLLGYGFMYISAKIGIEKDKEHDEKLEELMDDEAENPEPLDTEDIEKITKE